MAVDLERPNEKLLRTILEETREEPGRMTNNLKLLEDWMAKQPHMPKNYDKRILSTFLRGCKQNLDKTKKKLENYYIARAAFPELYGNPEISSQAIQRVKQAMTIGVSRKLTPDGCRIHFVRFNSQDPDMYVIEDISRYLLYLMDIKFVDDTIRAGDIYIHDATNFSPSFVPKIFHKLFRPMVALAQDGLATRFKAIHVFNANSLVVNAMNLVKPFINEKLRNRTFAHYNSDPLVELFPKDMIPVEYGGTGMSMDEMQGDVDKILEHGIEYLRSQKDVKCVGPIPEKAKEKFGGSFGAEGSFRKLEID